MAVNAIYQSHIGDMMKARLLKEGDQLFNPEGFPCRVNNSYYAADDILVIAFDNGYGMQVHPDRDLLVARKGEVL